MITEAKILFENIKHFRQLLTESVSDKTIIDAINEHKFLYIYYHGETTKETGYRTIRPMVLGVNQKNNLVLRAWQDKGRSDSLRPDAPRKKRYGHEHTVDHDGVDKAGWRLFIVANIASAIPNGKRFVDKSGEVEIPPGYKENDKDMTGGIIASVSGEELPSNVLPMAKQKMQRWEKYKDANKNNRQINKNDVAELVDIAKKIYKKPITDFFVAIDNRNEYNLQDIRTKGKFPQNAYVDDLPNLYNRLLMKTPVDKAAQDQFAKNQKDKMIKGLAEKQNENNPINKKTFFKQ
jgi:phosphoribosylanthranilate isomerase